MSGVKRAQDAARDPRPLKALCGSFGPLWGLQRLQAKQGKVQLVDRVQYAEQLGLVSHRPSQGSDLAIAGVLFNVHLQLAEPACPRCQVTLDIDQVCVRCFGRASLSHSEGFSNRQCGADLSGYDSLGLCAIGVM